MVDFVEYTLYICRDVCYSDMKDMKRIFVALTLALLTCVALYAASDAKIEFETTSVDFGRVPANGGPVKMDYKFTNTGTAPLVIVTVTNGGCGCTKPTFPKAPVQPGQSGVITVNFNPAGRSGGVNREVKVRTNAGKKTIKLRFKGTIIPNK